VHLTDIAQTILVGAIGGAVLTLGLVVVVLGPWLRRRE
jgi:hypothetical protein